MFPENDYTPFGYLDNPFHTWKLNRSGVFRVSPPVGFEWLFPNANKPFLCSALNIGMKIDNQLVLLQPDWQNVSILLKSPYHSKNVFCFEWQWFDFSTRCEFFLADEKGLAVKIHIKRSTTANANVSVLLLQSVQLKYGKTGLWDFGLTGSVKKDLKSSTLKTFAEGHCFTLKFSEPSDNYFITDELEAINDVFLAAQFSPHFFSTTKNKIFSLINIPVHFREKDDYFLYCLTTRGVSEKSSLDLSQNLFNRLEIIRGKKIIEDSEFWDDCPQLSGDWPPHWKRGWVYDWETLRMNVRKPAGIFTTEWDAMQIQKPRIVLAETALDMLMMSYADPELSQRIILGLFKDGLGPQIPCAREDGSLNMISEDGSECGTSPAWCYPFYCFLSIFGRHKNLDWLRELYPYLEKYLNWWLKNRTDEQGWAVYNCSWESGQDDSIKFLIDQPTGGEIVRHLHAVDLQAALVQAAAVMSDFCNNLGSNPEKWDQVQSQFAEKTQAMWQKDWFCDFDKRTEKWINKKDYRDITNLAPFLAGIYSEKQVQQIEPWFEHFKENRKYWLEWPSFFFMYLEACWQVGFKKLAADVLFATADRVYRNWDRRDWKPGEPMPGISIECWGCDKPYGAEGYGWGASLPIHIIRSLIGFREELSDAQFSFILCPNLPEKLLAPKKKYSIDRLKFQTNQVALSYEVVSEDKLICRFAIESKEQQRFNIVNEQEQVVFQSQDSAQQHTGSFVFKNRESVQFQFFGSNR